MAITEAQKFHLKKFIKDLENFRGRHTELVSVYVPEGYDLNKIIAVLPNTNLEQAKMTSAKLAKELKMDEIMGLLPGLDTGCSVNVGFAEAEKDIQMEHLIKNAESDLDEICFYK